MYADDKDMLVPSGASQWKNVTQVSEVCTVRLRHRDVCSPANMPRGITSNASYFGDFVERITKSVVNQKNLYNRIACARIHKSVFAKPYVEARESQQEQMQIHMATSQALNMLDTVM